MLARRASLYRSFAACPLSPPSTATMPQTITTSQPEVTIVRHAFDADPSDVLYILDCTVTAVNGAPAADPSPAWFSWRPVELDPLGDRSRIDLEITVRPYGARTAGVSDFVAEATVSDTQATSTCSWAVSIGSEAQPKILVHFNLQSAGSGPFLTAYQTDTAEEIQQTEAPGFNVDGDPYSDWAYSAHNAGGTGLIYYEDYGENYAGGIKRYDPTSDTFSRVWDAPYSMTTYYNGVGIDAAFGRAWILDNLGTVSTIPLDGNAEPTARFTLDTSLYSAENDPRIDVDEERGVIYIGTAEAQTGYGYPRLLKYNLDGTGEEILYSENFSTWFDDIKADRVRGGVFAIISGEGLYYNAGTGTTWDLIDDWLDSTSFIAVDNDSEDGLVYGVSYRNPFGGSTNALWSLPRTGGTRQMIWSGNWSIGYLALL